jgi:Lar family restriction alleviation protein
MNNLLPCPFCGGEADIFEASEDSFCTLCTDCGVETPYQISAEEAVAAWNRRAQPSEKPEPLTCTCGGALISWPTGNNPPTFAYYMRCAECGKLYSPDVPPRHKSEPLTLDELRGMHGEPVYVTRISGAKIRMWVIACPNEYGLTQARTADSQFMAWSTYGRIWLAFRSKPKEEV